MGIFDTDASILVVILLNRIQFAICDTRTCLYFIFNLSDNVDIVTQGKGKSPKEVLKRIDYGGSATLLIAVCIVSCLVISSHQYLLFRCYAS